MRMLLKGAAALIAGVLFAPLAAAGPIEVTDIEGRPVTLNQPAKRVLLGEGRDLMTLALLSDDPVALTVGWLGELKRFDPGTYRVLKAKFPRIDEIPLVGTTNRDSFSAEQAVALKPDLAVFGSGHGPSKDSVEVMQALEAAGVPIVFVDFRADPLRHTVPSLRLLGRALGVEARAEAYIAFYEARRDRIAAGVAGLSGPRPKVVMDMRPRVEDGCCRSPGKGNLGPFIDFAGGHNIGADVLPGALGELNPEFVLAQNPDLYIATGVRTENGAGGVALGTGIGPEEARQALAEVAGRPTVAALGAVQSGRAYGLWHNFYNSPLNILALEALARWIHPDAFADVDPERTLAEINDRFLAVPLEGTYWTGLAP